MAYMTIKTLPNSVTFLDCIKTFAVIVMVIDHIGFYFFPELTWFRAIGRACVPVWFFMAGYANSREIPNKLWCGAFVLFAMDLFLFGNVFSLNALVTFILIRLSIDRFADVVLQSRYLFFLLSLILMLVYIPTNMVFEYGSHAFLLALLGYIVRHRDEVIERTFVTQKNIYGFMLFLLIGFCAMQNVVFGFSQAQFIFMAAMSAAVIIVLSQMQPQKTIEIKGEPLKRVLQFCGRKTLEIYVVHLIVFKVVIFVFLALK